VEEKEAELRALEDESKKRSAGSEPVAQLKSHKQVLAKELKALQAAVEKARAEQQDKQAEFAKLQQSLELLTSV